MWNIVGDEYLSGCIVIQCSKYFGEVKLWYNDVMIISVYEYEYKKK